MVEEVGGTIDEMQLIMVPYTLNLEWRAIGLPARVAAPTHIIAAADAGAPLRTNSYSETKGAADVIAEAEDAKATTVRQTLAALASNGHVVKGKAGTPDRNKVNVWLPAEPPPRPAQVADSRARLCAHRRGRRSVAA
ncbi:hypothetical protein [Reyranella soli]|uniref:Uncharacterized protein n=1 Tax=Reyranella soli TaxID=1230389 RepID=A0A512NQE3_9HYPH|nr:hypothetical protein [Reyranella soli]GEP61168.1 hypothetical protein RSO01_83340 [Reyranella soli]